MKNICQLKDFSFHVSYYVAQGKVPIPATMQSPEFFGLSIWLTTVRDPIIITYETQEERDKEYANILFAVEDL